MPALQCLGCRHPGRPTKTSGTNLRQFPLQYGVRIDGRLRLSCYTRPCMRGVPCMCTSVRAPECKATDHSSSVGGVPPTAHHELIPSLVDVREAGTTSCSGAGRGTTRRKLMLGGCLGGALLAQPSEARQEILLPSGESVESFEFRIPLRLVALRGSLSDDWVMDFRRVGGNLIGLQVEQRGQLADIFEELGKPSKRKSAGKADAVSLGDDWLAPAIQRRLIQPIPDAETSRWWQTLSPRWQQLVRRGPDGLPHPKGHIFGAPYSWGCTLVAYRSDKLLRGGGRPFRDWSDLLDPRLKGRVAFMESPRELVGVALKTLGLGYNARRADLAAAKISVQDLRARIQQLCAQVRLFSNRDLTQALAAGDVWATVGWSGDLIPLSQRSGNIDVAAPLSGTALWANVWMVPMFASNGNQKRGPSPVLPAWLEFGLQPHRAERQRDLRSGASPLLLPHFASPVGARARAPAAAGAASSGRGGGGDSAELVGGIMPTSTVLSRSEFLLPLDAESQQLYWELLDPGWTTAGF